MNAFLVALMLQLHAPPANLRPQHITLELLVILALQDSSAQAKLP
jgi:hypothetical protein